jgi:hypothetical protein
VVKIYGAPAGAPITVNFNVQQNGVTNTGTASVGNVLSDGTMTWEDTIHSSNVGTFTENYMVNGTPLMMVNPSAYYASFAPTLPTFTIFPNYTGSALCPGPSSPASLSTVHCSNVTPSATHWDITPVAYSVATSLGDVYTAAQA